MYAPQNYTLMRNPLLISLVVLTTLLSCKKDTAEKNDLILKQNTTNEIHFFTSDSVKIYGDMYIQNHLAPTILLLHQAGSNAKAEYKNIIPQLHANGFNTLAIDQRLGSSHFYGGTNRTAAQLKTNQYNFCDAYADVDAALNYIKTTQIKGKIILWGSSYSGSLAIQLANKNKAKVNGVLAFSPASGGPMENCNPEVYFETLKLPLLILRPFSEMQSRKSQSQFEAAKLYGHKTYVAQNGVHGSSLLDESRVEGSTDENWTVVNTFLEQFK